MDPAAVDLRVGLLCSSEDFGYLSGVMFLSLLMDWWLKNGILMFIPHLFGQDLLASKE